MTRGREGPKTGHLDHEFFHIPRHCQIWYFTSTHNLFAVVAADVGLLDLAHLCQKGAEGMADAELLARLDVAMSANGMSTTSNRVGVHLLAQLIAAFVVGISESAGGWKVSQLLLLLPPFKPPRMCVLCVSSQRASAHYSRIELGKSVCWDPGGLLLFALARHGLKSLCSCCRLLNRQMCM